MKNLFILSLVALLPVVTVQADIVLSDHGATEYQVVIPDAGAEEIVDHWLLASAKLVQAVFQTNGCPIAVVRETERDPNKPAIYLGATAFAREQGIRTETYADWAYHLKVVGRDLIIAGNDRKDPVFTIRRMSTPRALLGTVKGVCDFLREFAGVRFLFLNMDQSLYATRGGGLNLFTPEGALHLDPRSFAFLPTPRIAVPVDLDRTSKPLMRANCDFSWETFHYIALNFYPMLSHVLGSSVTWNGAIPPAEYCKSHPDYFALQADGRRACELKIAFDDDMQYCVTHPDVQDLMVQAAEKLIEAGEKTIRLATLDGFCLCRCNCENCTELFGVKAENMAQVYERGRSGKLWQVFFAITERVRRKHPEVRIVVGDYQDTPVNPEVIREFPENVILKVQFASQLDFDRLKGIRIPAGICGFEESFTGFGQAGPYLPERTPEHMAEVVQAMARNNVKWSARDGSIGYVRGLQAPAYYVYGRMMDDPSADWQAIHKEFCSAAFGNVAAQMEHFFDQLHSQIAIYSDYFGVMMPGWNRKYARTHFRDSKWHVMSMYPPEYCAAADAQLASAERLAQGADVKARLHLLRVEFDYIRTLANIFFLQNAWTLNPSRTTMDPLLDTIDGWHAFLAELASRSRGQTVTGVVQNCEIRNCSVGPGTAFDSGGGVYGGYSSSGKSYLIVSNCMFRSNRSETGQAGALYASLTYGGLVTHCHFEDNWAKTLGGALFSRSTGGELVEFCVFLNNFADSQGSAIAGNYGLIVLRNSLVAGHPDDSAITAISATLHLQNSTVVYNSGWGVRMDSTGAALKTWNSIIYFNGNNLNTGPTCAFTNTCSTPVNAYFTLAGTGNIIDNPQFADAAHGNYRLSSMSPCLNAGTNLPWTLDAVDLDGHPRVDRGGPRIVDMGCYETTYSGSAIVIR